MPLFSWRLIPALLVYFALTVTGAQAKQRLWTLGDAPGGFVVRVFSTHAQFENKHEVPAPEGYEPLPPSRAAKIAQKVYGGKILTVRLIGNFYMVKLRGQGKVRIVRVHAGTGRIMKR